MAIYSLQIKVVKRSAGHSAIAKIAYTARVKLTNYAKNETFNYSSKQHELLHSEIRLNHKVVDNKYREEIWNNAEAAEHRIDSRVAREYVLALPFELTLQNNIRLVREFADYLYTEYKVICDFAIHDQKENNKNIHCHLVTSTREVVQHDDNFEFKERSKIEWNNTKCKKFNVPFTDQQIVTIRKKLETIINKYLKQIDINLTVSADKKEDRASVTKHVGSFATQKARMGIKSDLVEYNEKVYKYNALKNLKSRANKSIAYAKKRQQKMNNQHLLAQAESNLEYLNEHSSKFSEQINITHEFAVFRFQSTRIRCCAFYMIERVVKKYYEYFEVKNRGDYTYYATENDEIEIHKTHVSVSSTDYQIVQLAFDVALELYKNEIVVNGDEDFINMTLNLIMSSAKYDHVMLLPPEVQKRLEELRNEQHYQQILNTSQIQQKYKTTENEITNTKSQQNQNNIATSQQENISTKIKVAPANENVENNDAEIKAADIIAAKVSNNRTSNKDNKNQHRVLVNEKTINVSFEVADESEYYYPQNIARQDSNHNNRQQLARQSPIEAIDLNDYEHTRLQQKDINKLTSENIKIENNEVSRIIDSNINERIEQKHHEGIINNLDDASMHTEPKVKLSIRTARKNNTIQDQNNLVSTLANASESNELKTSFMAQQIDLNVDDALKLDALDKIKQQDIFTAENNDVVNNHDSKLAADINVKNVVLKERLFNDSNHDVDSAIIDSKNLTNKKQIQQKYNIDITTISECYICDIANKNRFVIFKDDENVYLKAIEVLNDAIELNIKIEISGHDVFFKSIFKAIANSARKDEYVKLFVNDQHKELVNYLNKLTEDKKKSRKYSVKQKTVKKDNR